MNLADYFDKNFIIPELSARTKSEVLAELVSVVVEHVDGVNPDKAFTVLMDREGLGTTGIGDEIAIPHGKLAGMDAIRLVVGRSREGVEFDSLDHKPCTIFFMVLAPEDVAGQHLRLLAQISRLLKDPTFRESFHSAPDADAIWQLITSL